MGKEGRAYRLAPSVQCLVLLGMALLPCSAAGTVLFVATARVAQSATNTTSVARLPMSLSYASTLTKTRPRHPLPGHRYVSHAAPMELEVPTEGEVMAAAFAASRGPGGENGRRAVRQGLYGALAARAAEMRLVQHRDLGLVSQVGPAGSRKFSGL